MAKGESKNSKRGLNDKAKIGNQGDKNRKDESIFKMCYLDVLSLHETKAKQQRQETKTKKQGKAKRKNTRKQESKKTTRVRERERKRE